MTSLLHAFRHAARTLARGRMVTGLAVVAFGLGIGVTTAVFSIFDSILLRPLAYPDPHELVLVYDTQPACDACPASFPKYHDWKDRSDVFDAIGGSTPGTRTLTGFGEPARVAGMQTTASLVDVLGVPPAMGRWYTAEEDQPGGPKVIVLSHEFWTTRFGGERGVLGRQLTLDGNAYEVIGVMPADFSHRNAEFFVPLQRELDPATRGNHFMSVYARLRDEVTPEQAAIRMRALGESLAAEFGHNHGIDVRSYHEAVVGNIRTPLQILLGVVFFVLLIACANVANLLLASGIARRRELAIRLALGASARHLARQLAAEGLLLAVAGGLLGVLLAFWAVRTFLVLAEDVLPRAASVSIDGRVLAFSAGVTLLVGIACGLWPLVRLRSAELASAVRETDTRTGSGSHVGSGLVVVEIALAFALLVGGGLLVKNLVRLQARDAGIRTDRIVAFDLNLAGPRYQAPEQVQAFYRDLQTRLADVGSIESVGLTSHLPMYRYGWNSDVNVEGGNPWRPEDAPLVENRWIYGDLFATLGVPLLKGRLLDARDASALTVVINQAAAEAFWPGQDPIGRRFGGGTDPSSWQEVVGVIGNMRSAGLTSPVRLERYFSLDQQAFNSMTVVLRTRGEDPMQVMPTARSIVAALDPALPITAVQTMASVVGDSVGQPRLLTALTGLFAGLAGLLAMVGVYGVMAYNVRRQRREYGIRLALGAHHGAVERLVVGRGLVLSAIGIGAGAFGAWLLTGVLQSMLNDVTATDPLVFAATALGVLVAAALASYPSARSAGRVDPIVVLRDS